MANKVYARREAAIIFKATGGTVTFDPMNLANGAGRQSAQYDLYGALGAKSPLYEWRAIVRANTAPTVGKRVDVSLKTWDEGGTLGDNDDGTTDAPVSAEDKTRNLHFLGSVIADEAATGVDFISSGLVGIRARYIAVVFWNRMEVALVNTTNLNHFILTPVPDEVQ